MSTQEALTKATTSTRAWYVAAFGSRDVVNIQAFSRLRQGRRLFSLSWHGFRLFEDPVHAINYGYASLYWPWEIWRVRPVGVLGYEPSLVADYATRQLRARGLEAIERMPDGFEFGPHGAIVRTVVEDLANLSAQPPRDVDVREYNIAMTFLSDQRANLTRVEHERVNLAIQYLDTLVTGTADGQFCRCKRRLPPNTPVFELLEAAVAGSAIPPVIAERWTLTSLRARA